MGELGYKAECWRIDAFELWYWRRLLRVPWTARKSKELMLLNCEHQRIDAFGLLCWRRLLRVPWTARKSNQSILKEISPGCSLKRLMLKLKLPTLWPPDAKSWLIWKDPDAGKDWGQEEQGAAEDGIIGRYHWFNEHQFDHTLRNSEGQKSLVCYSCKELNMTRWLNNNKFPSHAWDQWLSALSMS